MRKLLSKIRLDFIDILVLAFYYIFVCFLFLGLFGFFNRLAIVFVLFILLLALFFLRNSISFSKKYLWFFLIAPIITAGVGFLRGFFTGDAYELWLPVGREIAQTGFIPEFFTGRHFARMPLLSLLFAGTFSIFNFFNEFLCLWVPFFFTSATLVVVYKWAKEKNLDKKFLFFIPFLFLTNLLISFLGWNLLQESILLFFATTFFYYYDKYQSDNKRKYLVLLILSFVLVCASKISGFYLGLLIIWIFFKTKDKMKFVLYLFLFSVPILLWILRNYLVFDNPFYPFFNNIFKGQYYLPAQQFSSYHTGLAYFNEHIWNKIRTIFSYLYMIFPFLLLSFYGFFKKKRYDYLFFIISFCLLKEIFLFTTTISIVRYYYFVVGLLLVYGLLGLQQVKSKLAISCLILLAIGGLFLLPITDSTSQFISSFENKFALFYTLFIFLKDYWYLILIILAPFAYLASKKKDIKIFLIFLYSLYFLHIHFIANKSWINTWPFVFFSLLFLIIFAFKKKFKYFKQIIITLIALFVFTNSWAIASVYYWHQGNVTLPVPYVWEPSAWARPILDQETIPTERDDFYLLLGGQKEYFIWWWTDYQVINLFDIDFWMILGDYSVDLSDLDLKQLFIQKKVKYIVKNKLEMEYDDLFNKNLNQFFELVRNSDNFTLIAASEDNKYFIWQVY